MIREASIVDVPGLQRVYRASSLSNGGDRAALLAHPGALQFSETAVREGRTRVAVSGGEVIGFATFAASEDGLELEDLFVDPDRMRQHIGSALIADVVKVARDRGDPRLVVTANPHARLFYEAVGFVHDGDADTEFGPGLLMHFDLRP